MAYRTDINSFVGGEIGRQVRARHDTAKYKTGLDLARNVLLLPAGGAYNRPGFRFGSELKDSSVIGRLFPFTFSLNQSYALEFTDEMMRVYYDGGLVLRPELIVTYATQSNPLVVTIPANGYEVGMQVYFTGQLGMTELNNKTLTVIDVDGDDVTFDADSTGWGLWLGSEGGVPGDDGGGTGGEPADPPVTPPPIIGDEPPPPTCVWAESYIAPGLMAGDAAKGSPLTKMHPDGSGSFAGQVDAILMAYAPGYRVTTESGVRLTMSDTAPVPVQHPERGLIYIKAKALPVGSVVAVSDADGFRWEPVTDIDFVGMIRVAKITTGDGVYGAGDVMGRMIFTHNIKYERPDTLEPI